MSFQRVLQLLFIAIEKIVFWALVGGLFFLAGSVIYLVIVVANELGIPIFDLVQRG